MYHPVAGGIVVARMQGSSPGRKTGVCGPGRRSGRSAVGRGRTAFWKRAGCNHLDLERFI